MDIMVYKCTSRGEKEMRKRMAERVLLLQPAIENKTRIKWKKSVYEGR
jgi:hypothetical protein